LCIPPIEFAHDEIMLETFPFPMFLLYYIFCLWEEKILRFLIIRRFDVNWKRFLFNITRHISSSIPLPVFPDMAGLIPAFPGGAFAGGHRAENRI